MIAHLLTRPTFKNRIAVESVDAAVNCTLQQVVAIALEHSSPEGVEILPLVLPESGVDGPKRCALNLFGQE
jgi:hypothetical protein